MNLTTFFRRGTKRRLPAPKPTLVVEPLEPRDLLTFGGMPYAVGPTVVPTSTQPEAEEQIAVDPSDFHNLLAGVTDYGVARLGRHPPTAKYAFSADNGTSWADNYVAIDPVSGLLPTADARVWDITQDPVVAIDKLGNVYFANLYLNFDPVTGTIHQNGLYVSVSTVKSLSKPGTGANSGFTAAQTYPVIVNGDANTESFEDKEWIAVDNSNSAYSGNVYAAWTHIAANGNEAILFARSTDHAQTWSAPIQLTPKNKPLGRGGIQGSQLAVGPNGEVYLVYGEHLFDGSAQLSLSRSTDGGITFSKPVAITPNFHSLSFDSTYAKESWPALAVSPSSGAVYVVYADQPNKTVGAEVEFIRSTNGGANFSNPAALNDIPTGQQFMAAVAVDEVGAIHASWFDTRNSPSGSSVFDIYATASNDGGATFRPNARVTQSSIDVGVSPFIGDYCGIAAGGGFAHPVWTTGVVGGTTTGIGGLRTATLLNDSTAALRAAFAAQMTEARSTIRNPFHPMSAEDIAHWQAAGLDTSTLVGIDVRIADCGGTTLGLASGHTIWRDDNAAGWGWLVDKTPHNDSEFTTPGDQGEQHRMDLLTVLEPEVGHLLSFDHQETGVMQDTLAAGTRRLPAWGEAFIDAAIVEWMRSRRN